MKKDVLFYLNCIDKDLIELRKISHERDFTLEEYELFLLKQGNTSDTFRSIKKRIKNG